MVLGVGKSLDMRRFRTIKSLGIILPLRDVRDTERCPRKPARKSEVREGPRGREGYRRLDKTERKV